MTHTTIKIRDAIVSAIVTDSRVAFFRKNAREANDVETHAFYVDADERFARICENAVNVDADALFTRYMYTCSACDKTARASHRDYASAMRSLVSSSVRVTSAEVVRCFDYCATCMMHDTFDATIDDDDKAIVLAIIEHEHVKTFHETSSESVHVLDVERCEKHDESFQRCDASHDMCCMSCVAELMNVK